MAALRSRCGHSILPQVLSSFFFSSSSGRRLDVYHIDTHDVALCCTRLAENTRCKNYAKKSPSAQHRRTTISSQLMHVSTTVIFQFRVLFSITILFHVVNFSFYSTPVILKRSIFSFWCVNFSSTSSSSSSNNKINEYNLSMQFLQHNASAVLVKLVNTHYTLKIQCVKSHCAKFGTFVLRNKNIESSEKLECGPISVALHSAIV